MVYVIEGGQFHIYDTTTSADTTTIDVPTVVGTLVDVKAVDQPQQ